MTNYPLTLTIYCPGDKLAEGNSLAAITGEGGAADLLSFRRVNHTHGFVKAQLQAPANFGDWLKTSLNRPEWDDAKQVDVAGAQALLSNAVILKEIPETLELEPGRMYIGVNCDPGSVLGLETIPDE